MEALSRREEEEIETAAKTDALKACDDYVRAFAKCCEGRTFTQPFVCAAPFKAMNACIKEEMSVDRIDTLKLEYIANRSEKGRLAVEALLQQRKEKLIKMSGKREDELRKQEEYYRLAREKQQGGA
ncbi:uncharacterized protein LOC62_03G004499 [Vanrija pseudolonga]|uniref:COX assembly mitochondrial protein n=1 Tax=Vanrija pseudolonga TaxID=143232 RepID=A0AAF1BQI0_9TREE|nr:hypothetical protein LOC62_03G004499 [Vanrija pseudolonga]